MKLEDILTLVNAGFSKSDIIALASGTVDTIQAADPEQPASTDTETEPEQVPAASPAPASQKQEQDTTQELAQIRAQISALQRSNLQAATQPEGANRKQTPEDVWKDFFEKGD